MCTCSQPLDYDYHRTTRTLPIIEKSYDRHSHPHYSTAPRTTRYHASPDTYRGATAYTSTSTRIPLSSRRRSTTPPPVLIQSTPMGRSELSPRLSPGGRYSRSSRSSLDSPTSSIRSGEMGFNQPMVLQADGLGPVIHQGVPSSHYQAAHNTGYAPHVHAGGVRAAAGQRRYTVNPGGDRSSYIGYRSDQGSVGSDDGYISGGRLYTNEVRRSYGGRRESTPVRRYS
ncbi:uncharacterized protein LAJ45_03377 [Morchella importuna]|uniref:Uncharacterized protein n=1 Tax=Morchella conica CCBAS932 TaxID=1392247 RepID=A0A3N4KT30_9PEZI|nr:uncharacterized protein LAJ45_03377 [Morchella importuna]KAH8152537.1 hypothetical protein LAJ45_03377 [Morchella importuna]RPB13676.1 hypothetical protein P167DRAFT_572987 [Morchella conica CCBAS932]